MQKPSAPLTERRYVLPLVLVTSLFFLWALGVNLNDVLIPHLKKAFNLTDFRSSLIQSAFFGGYFLAALPAGWVMERVGYKKGILFGLLICATGAFLFIPASYIRLYGFFLFALFVMACGQSFLEVAANPYVTILGPAESSERRLNLAQSFNAVGAVVTPFIGAAFILSALPSLLNAPICTHQRPPTSIGFGVSYTSIRRNCRHDPRSSPGLPRSRSQHGARPVHGDRRNISLRRGHDLLLKPAGSPRARRPARR